MTIALFGPEKVELDRIADLLRREELSAAVYSMRPQSQAGKPDPQVTQGVLIFPESGIVSIGDKTATVRRALAPDIPLTLCTSHLTADDRAVLYSCGASAIITPQSWAVPHVAERVLAQLILSEAELPNASGPLRGATRLMRDLYKHIQTLGPLSEPILITGERGAGKELVARELHNHSNRPDSFLPINCAEIDNELLNSELFGHEKGAFTGAIQSRKGMLVAAGRGTVLLDEIGDLNFSVQAKLLRLLEEMEVKPVGSNRWEKVLARIVMATNRDLDRACEEQKFRLDLYDRMKGFTLSVPPLRERKADIPLLAHHFVDAFNSKNGRQLSVPDGAFDCLFCYDWPGNVRELRAVIRKAAAYSDGADRISTLVLQESVRGRALAPPGNSVSFDPEIDTWPAVRRRAHRAYFNAVLVSTEGNKEAASKLSGLSRTQFYDNLRRLENEVIEDED